MPFNHFVGYFGKYLLFFKPLILNASSRLKVKNSKWFLLKKLIEKTIRILIFKHKVQFALINEIIKILRNPVIKV